MNILNEELLVKNIEHVAQYDISNNKVFGSAYLVYQEGNLMFEKCYGTLSLKIYTPITHDTLFRLASMTKPITSVATLILADRGLLSLDDRVDKYLPQFNDVRITDGSYNDLGKPKNIPTIRHILSHTSGIGSSGGKVQNMTDADRKTIDNTIDFLIRTGLDYEPGSKQMYSGMGAFDVLTKIIELVSGMDFLSFLEKEIFMPCNMLDTTFVPNAGQYERLVNMHTCIDDKNAEFEMPAGCIFENFPCTHYLGGAGLVSTLCDYSKFAKMLLNKGKIGNIQILREGTFNSLCTPQISKDIMPGTESWGLGVRVITEETYTHLPAGAFGWSGAYGSHFWIDPTNKIIAVFMKNSKIDGGAGNESARGFEQAVYSSF